MGFKDFGFMNSAHLAKQAWRAYQNPSALWVLILKAVYFPESEFLQASRKRNSSVVWSSLMHGKEVIRKFAGWSIGDGADINILQDRWVGDGGWANPREGSSLINVSELMENTRRSWDVQKIHDHFSSEDAMRIIQTPISWTSKDSLF